MLTTNKSGISLFVNACLQNGMEWVVCSPGSRNAPLVISFDEHPDIKTIVIHDERSAAFYALGMSLILHKPVGVVCTSGSAMLNYYPAVAEAYYQGIPLVVMTADRPEEWVNHGDGQTIVQKGVYTNHIRFEASISEFVYTDQERDLLSHLVHEAFLAGNKSWKGPVHFNFPLTEPLYGKIEIPYHPAQIISSDETQFTIDENQKDFLRNSWSLSKRKMVLCGQLPDNDSLKKQLVKLADDNSVIVLVENTSNLVDENFIHCVDRTLAGILEEELPDFQPDLLISIGESVISKRIKDLLRNSDITEHWKIGYSFPEMDTYRKLTQSFECEPEVFLSELNQLELKKNLSEFALKWKQKDTEIRKNIPSFFVNAPHSDLSVFKYLIESLPNEVNLHMANSSVVRYCQLFDPHFKTRYYSNRGTSGIDGSSSTACGAAYVDKDRLNILITGDVSFFYDSNAFWSDCLRGNLRIILIHNGGGGIFRIIDGPASTNQLEKYFEAKHSFKAEFICKAFDINYTSIQSLEDLAGTFDGFLKDETNNRPKLIEVFTDSAVNDKVLKEYFNQAKLIGKLKGQKL